MSGNAHQVDVQQLLDELRTVVRDGQELLRTQFGSLKERTLARAEETRRYAREKPYQTVGIAFGIGLLVGLLAAARSGRGSCEEKED